MRKNGGLVKRIACLLLVLALGAGMLPPGQTLTAWADEPSGQSDGTVQDDAAANGSDTQPGPGAQPDTDAQTGSGAAEAQTVANVVIFARLAQDANNDFNAPGSRESILRQYETGDNSLANYIRAVSGGRMRVENIFPQIGEDGQIRVLTLSERAYTDSAALIGEVVRALAAAQPGDALYLDPDTYTLDNLRPGVLDNLTVVLQGASFGGRNGAFSSRYTGEETLAGGVRVSSCNALPSCVLIDWTNADGGTSKSAQSGQGVLARELLHTLGLPDQYWSSRDGVPVGSWDVMGTAAYVPQYPLGYQRMQLGWLDDAAVQTAAAGGDYTLAAADGADGVKLLLIETPRSAAGETICLEYRRKASGDAFENGIYTTGLIAYRAERGGQSPLANTFYVYRPGDTAPNDADGLNENGRNRVENAALDADGAAYGSTDLAAGLTEGTLYYSDGSNSGVRISDLSFSADGGSVTFRLDFAAAPEDPDGAANALPSSDTPDADASGTDDSGTDESGTDDFGTGASGSDGSDSDESGSGGQTDSLPSSDGSGTDDAASLPPSSDASDADEPDSDAPDSSEPADDPAASDAPADGEPTDTEPTDAEPAEPEEPAILLHLTPPEGYADPHIYVDGVAYDAQPEEGGIVAQLPDTSGKLAVMYFYNENGIPKGMYVWRLAFEGAVCTATPLPGLQDLFSYHGFSIRVQSPSGIRFKSGIDAGLRDRLTADGVDGYRLTEYGTMSIAASNLGKYPFVKGNEKVRSGRSYWTENGAVNDRIIETVDGRHRFASVLTGVPDRQISSQIAFRAYAVLVDGAGTEMLVYGPPVTRSIYTVSQQVAAAGEFREGSNGYNYIQGLLAVGAPGWHTADGQTYYIAADGQLMTGLRQIDGQNYYFSGAGDLQKGWQELDGKRYYFDASTGAQLVGTGWQSIEGRQYYFSAESFALTGDVEIDGVTWRLDPATGATYPNGWNTINGQIFYYQYGTYYKNGVFEIDKKLCHFTAEGYYIAPPVINNVLYTSSGDTATVTITATPSALTTLHEAAYSWDGGATWTNQASMAFAVNTTLAAGMIQVRDALGNVSAYGSEMTLAPSTGPYMGIDVSSYQGPIDWRAVKASGVEFAIIRALTWSNSAGYYVIDPYFEYNVRNAKANGIRVGAYLFSYAFNINEIKEEVDFFHNSTQMNALRRDNIRMDFPVYIDFEWNRILERTDYDTRTQIVRTGMILLEKYGYRPGFYSSLNWAKNYYDAASLAREGYDFWVARYALNPDLASGTAPWLGYRAQMWQYASDGAVNGISGNVDLNICYVDYGSAGGSSGSEVSLGLSVYDVNSKAVVSGAVEDILAQIVMNEVGGMNHAEVYKAQAVAAYSWILYQQAHGNAIPSVGLRAPSDAVRAAVREVSGKTLFYNGSAANAAYGSASGPMTNTARNMWGLELPYLNTPVESPEGEWRGKQNTIAVARMQENLTKLVGGAAVAATPHGQWLTDPVFDGNGYLTSIKVCGQTVGGGRFYENCWGLYSPKFSFQYDAGSDSWVFTTDGNGHCVGMSQYGALVYANQGWNYQQILAHYYPGTTLQ